jgi:2-oxoglutarate dehydrogenase E1 component
MLDAFVHQRFQLLLPEQEVERAARVLVCSGKIVHELRHERQTRKDGGTAIISLEQLYPFPEQELAGELNRHSEAREIVWVQEEPANMGAISVVVPELERLGGGRPVRSVKRSASASTATGSAKAHDLEQRALLTLAFGVGRD